MYQEGISGECSCENHEKLSEIGFRKRNCLLVLGNYVGPCEISAKALKFFSITLN